MRPGAGKAKGAAFERLVCKELSLWVTNGHRDDVFWRSAMSGGRATVHKKGGKTIAHVSGDIAAVHKEGNEFIRYFFVECKNMAKFELHRMVFGKGGPLMDFWGVARTQAHSFGKSPMLIAKQNLFPSVVVLSGVGVEQFNVGDMVLCWSPPHDAAFVGWQEFRDKVDYAQCALGFRPSLGTRTAKRTPLGHTRVGGRPRMRSQFDLGGNPR